MNVCILFQDKHLIVVIKPYGVLSEAHDTQPNMPAILLKQCGFEVYPVHRLDKTTQGLMVYAKTRSAAALLSAMMQRGEVQKNYLAVVEGIPEDHGEMNDLLYFDRTRGKSYVVRRERRGVKRAELRYDRLSVAHIGGVSVSEVRVQLLTGRTHQIRVQFASRKMPLVGDRRYGSRIPAQNIALCSCELCFTHPVSSEELRFAYSPEDDVFTL